MSTHWKKLTNPDYLGAYAFERGEEKVFTIKLIKEELVTGADGKKEQCIVAHFAEDVKPMVMCKTNLKTISKIYKTPYIEEWAGKKIAVYVEKVKAFGEIVEALRIRSFIPKQAESEPDIMCEECGKKITSGAGASAAQIIAKSKARFNRTLCLDCAVKASEALKSEEERNENENNEN